MDPGLFLWGSGDGNRVEALSPETLANSHPLWAEDVIAFGPWSKFEAPLLGPGRSDVMWRSLREGPNTPVLVCGRCPTSMDVAWALDVTKPLPDWASVMTVEQTAGRGRWHRQWMSPPGNLHATWIWPSELDKYGPVLAIPELLSLVVAFMVGSALKTQNLDVQIKWPNDLFWKSHKIGGVLIERKQMRTMVGMGLNLVFAPSNEALEREGAPPAASLSQAGLALSPMSGWLKLSWSAKMCLEEQIRSLSPSAFISLVEGRLVGMGQNVVVQTGQGEPFTARIKGLAPDGGLVLQRRQTQSVLYSGSIHLTDS